MSDRRESLLVPPHSIEAEKAVLGGILRSPDHFHLVLDKVGLLPEQFYVDLHKTIFEVMSNLDAKGIRIDILTLAEHLTYARDLTAEPHVYLVDLTQSCPIAQNIEYYADIVKKKFFLRKVIQACQETVQKALTTGDEVHHFIETVEKEFLSIASDNDRGKGLVSAKSLLVPTLEDLEQRIALDGQVTGISSGFMDLDKITGGWQKSDLIILAARPGMGKTALALNWVMNAIKSNDSNIAAVFTLEMASKQLLERLLSAEGRIDSTKLRKGDLNDDDQDRLMRAARFMNDKGVRLVIDETPAISIGELRSRCRRYQKEHGLNMIVVDYLQLMTGSQVAQKQGREREIGEISMGLKALAKELAVPVIALAQLNRGPDARPDKRPRISDLRESGSMEQDADQIMFVYRDEYYNPNSEHVGKAEVMIAKNRHGETGSIHLAWLPNFVSFHNLMRE